MKTQMNLKSWLLLVLLLNGLDHASAFYDPSTQRWINRDPIEEEGGINLYRLLANDPVDLADADGLVPDGPTPSEFGAAACAQQAIKCMQDCMKKRAPYPWGNYPPSERKGAKYRYCEEKCQAEYMACMKLVEKACEKASQANLAAAAAAVLAIATTIMDAPIAVGCGLARAGCRIFAR